MDTMICILAALALASVGTKALAADDAVKEVRKQAKATYQMDKKGCDALKGDEKKNCRHQAKAKYDQAVAETRSMKREDDKHADATKEQKRDAKRREKVHSGGDRSYRDKDSANRGASGDPGRYMGNAPTTSGGTPSN